MLKMGVLMTVINLPDANVENVAIYANYAN